MNAGSLKFKMAILVGLFAVVMLLLVGTTTYVVSSQSADARIIDIAGRQRMLTQKMSKEALAFASALQKGSSTEEQRKGLLKTVSLYDKSLQSLVNGGVTLCTDGEETRLSESMGDAKIQLNKVERLWTSFKKAVTVIADMSEAGASGELQDGLYCRGTGWTGGNSSRALLRSLRSEITEA